MGRIRRIQRGAGLNPGGEIGIGEEGDGIQFSFRQCGGGFFSGITHVADQEAGIVCPDRGEDIAALLLEKVAAHDKAECPSMTMVASVMISPALARWV
jgi:hypothetical protein